MRYQVHYNAGQESPWLNSFESALALAAGLLAQDARYAPSIVTDADEWDEDRLGHLMHLSALTAEQQDMVWEVLR